jgi:crotonyl-CoA carboxylase/reductase
MSAVAKKITPPVADAKSLYEVGEVPPLGHVPERMYAWAIRRERHGPPESSMQIEVVPTWPVAEDEVLVFVMAGGVNYNGIWAGLGQPISPFDVHKAPYHIAGSDAAGVVWAVGAKVRRWKVGDEVIVHCNQDDGDDEECNGGDPLLSPSQRIWGYETPDGSFAQFCRVQSRQLMPKPLHLSWEEAACYTLTLATAYRMLFGHPPHTLKPGQNVLVWGASGGLGVFGVQLAAASGANAIGIVSDAGKRDYVMALGAKGVLNRKDFACWGAMPTVNSPEYAAWVKEARKFGKAIWDITGKLDVDVVFEHPGEQTFPVSTLVVKRGGMVVFCAGTTGYNITFDARYVWMRQKRIQGSHFAHLKQASAANQFVIDRRIDPCMSEVLPWTEIALAHTKMWKNLHKPGNMAVLVNAPRAGLRNFDDVMEAVAG